MKKVLSVLICLLFIPMVVNAEVIDENYKTRIFYSEQECLDEYAKNDHEGNQQAVSGFWAGCVKIYCDNSRIKYDQMHHILEDITCANGNQNPSYTLTQPGIKEGEAPFAGSTCTYEPGEEGYFERDIWSIDLYGYNCEGQVNTSTTTTTSTTTQANQGGHGEKNPQTGIETYYLVLSALVITLGGSLYFINKKDLFKKI